eukprot:scaffold152962_cov22-Tisochrysis_lutea.AAC.4
METSSKSSRQIILPSPKSSCKQRLSRWSSAYPLAIHAWLPFACRGWSCTGICTSPAAEVPRMAAPKCHKPLDKEKDMSAPSKRPHASRTGFNGRGWSCAGKCAPPAA